MLTQTGGPSDIRSGEIEVPNCGCALDSNVMSIVADGRDAVRPAARHLLRDGSDFLKIQVDVDEPRPVFGGCVEERYEPGA